MVRLNCLPLHAIIIIIQAMDVKKVIKERGFTIEETAKRMGITRITLTQNLSRNPTVGTLQRIADAIGCEVGDFFNSKAAEPELTALVECQGTFYKASTIDELKEIVSSVETQLTNIQ